MYLVEAAPLINIPFKHPQSYSYYCADNVVVGSIVLAPIRNKLAEAVVLKCVDLQSQKMLLRKSNFSLKSVSQIAMPEAILSEQQIEMAYWMSEYYHFSLGKILKTILPKYTKRLKLEDLNKDKTFNIHQIGLKKEERAFFKNINFSSGKFEIIHLSGDVEYQHNAFVLDKIVKTGKQVLYLVPEVFMIKLAAKEFSKYFAEDYIVELHAGLGKTAYWQSWHKVKNNAVKIIIGTRSAIFAPFEFLGAIFIKDFYNVNYKQWDMNPKYDARDIAKYIAGKQKIKLFIEEKTPSVSSSYHIEKKNFISIVIKKNKMREMQQIEVVDMKDEFRQKIFPVISVKMTEKIEKTLKKGKKTLLFINRRGSATFTMCCDCGYVEKCPNCDVSLSYHIEKGKKLYCHHCGYMSDIFLSCPKCAGANIRHFGIGSEKVESEAKRLFPQARIVRVDSDTVKNPKEQEKIYGEIFAGSADIIIGTQMIAKTILPEVDFVGIINMDNMLNLPTFESGERGLKMLSDFKDIGRNILIQTYNPENKIFQIFKNNNIEDFYKDELEQRKIFAYPPFSRMAKLICRDKQNEKCRKSMTEFVANVENLKIGSNKVKISGPTPAFISRKKGLYEWHIILKFLAPDYAVRIRIFSLIPSEWEVDVNPESLL